MGIALSLAIPVIGIAAPVAGVVATIATVVTHALISRAFPRPNAENPTIDDILARQRMEQAQRRAERTVRRAQELASDIQRQGEKASLREDEAKQEAARAVKEVERMKEQLEEAANAAKRAQEMTDEASTAAREEIERVAREALEERERGQRMREEAEQAIAAARQDAERAQMTAEEQLHAAQTAKLLAEEVAFAAEEETRMAIEAKEQAERRLKEGIQPVVMPSPEEVAAAKRRVEYRDDCFHFAVAGVSGSGKSSLVNAFRGLSSRDAGAAAVGVTETTLEMTRYPDTNPENPFVWYDIPGAGTLKCNDWQYFNDQGLYVFDCIIVLFDNRFTLTDIAILVNARRFNIPTYIVRSKADQHIDNVIKETQGDDSDSDEEGQGDRVGRQDQLYKAARQKFIEETKKSVRANLEDANLPNQRVYMISSDMMRRLVRDKMPKKAIDEVELINDLLNQAYSRRLAQVDEMMVLANADSKAGEDNSSL